MTHQITIRARLNETVGDDGVGVPQSVTVTGAEFLAPSAITEIAQQVVDSYVGHKFGAYLATIPDWDMRSDDMQIKVVKRRV